MNNYSAVRAAYHLAEELAADLRLIAEAGKMPELESALRRVDEEYSELRRDGDKMLAFRFMHTIAPVFSRIAGIKLGTAQDALGAALCFPRRNANIQAVRRLAEEVRSQLGGQAQ